MPDPETLVNAYAPPSAGADPLSDNDWCEGTSFARFGERQRFTSAFIGIRIVVLLPAAVALSVLALAPAVVGLAMAAAADDPEAVLLVTLLAGLVWAPVPFYFAWNMLEGIAGRIALVRERAPAGDCVFVEMNFEPRLPLRFLEVLDTADDIGVLEFADGRLIYRGDRGEFDLGSQTVALVEPPPFLLPKFRLLGSGTRMRLATPILGRRTLVLRMLEPGLTPRAERAALALHQRLVTWQQGGDTAKR
jgi:hypothetical protein